MTLDFSRCRLPPFQHQREDTQELVEHPYFFIASEMRTGKSKIVVDAAQFLWERGVIDKVIIVAPAPVRDVWFDPQLGEVAKHLWINIPVTVVEHHVKIRMWRHGTPDENSTARPLEVYVTNYEFLCNRQRLLQLFPACGPKTLLVLDESSFVKNHAATRTKACLQLRRACGRVVLLNGTPIFHSPMDLFSQANILHPSILGCYNPTTGRGPFISMFKARYAVQKPVLGHGGKPLANPRGGGPILQTVGWTNLEDLEQRLKPYTVRRLQKDCLDLPPKLDSVMLTATLDASWPHYKSMRDEMVVWLKDGNVATSATAAVKAMRLSQITSGFLGGVGASGVGERADDALLESLLLDSMTKAAEDDAVYPQAGVLRGDEPCATISDVSSAGSGSTATSTRSTTPSTPRGTGTGAGGAGASSNIHEVGREKLDVLLWFVEQRLEADPNLHLVVWCRFRAELLRVVNVVHSQFPQFECGVVMGGQKRAERLAALALLKPETSPAGPVFVAGIEGTGSFGLDMCAAHTCVTMSSGYSPGRSAQTLDRLYGPGQEHPIAYYDIVAVGPSGQKTIDRDILLARRAGQDVATRTAEAWVRALTEE